MLSFFSESISAAWFFVLGTCIGSFLNVVVYRVPAGRSLNGPSRCPHCQNPIKWHDNIPVLGWLLIKGRCRNCEVDIAARYPRVEFLLGSVFLSLAVCDVALGAASWPGIEASYYRGFAWHLFDPHPGYLFIFASHAVVMSILLALALIEFDGHTTPIGLVVALAMGVIVVSVCSPVLPDGSDQKLSELFAVIRRADFASLFIRIAGIVYGTVMGGVIEWAAAVPREQSIRADSDLPHTIHSPTNRRGTILVFALLGGWLGIFALTCICTFMALLVRWTEFLNARQGLAERDGRLSTATDNTLSEIDTTEPPDQLSSFWPQQPLGQLFLATWFYLLTAGWMSKYDVYPFGWNRRLWIVVFTAASVAVFVRRRSILDRSLSA